MADLNPVGRSGMSVSRFCLGAMMFGTWGNSDHDDCIKIIHGALDAGINFVDTADIYSSGESEVIVGKALRGRRDEVILATKFALPMGGANKLGGSRRWIMSAVEGSLRRLDTDWIDLYQMHRPDPVTDVEETLEALTDLVRQGKVRTVGSSTFPAESIVEAQWAAQRRNTARFICEQPPYSILARGAEQAVLPTCTRYGMGAICWSPLASGWLTGRYRRGVTSESGRAKLVPARFDMTTPANKRKLDLIDALLTVSSEAGLPLTQLALAWVLEHPAVTSAIIGPRTMEQLRDLIPAISITLSTEVLDAIDDLVPPGTTVNPVDAGWSSPSLKANSRRRSAGIRNSFIST